MMLGGKNGTNHQQETVSVFTVNQVIVTTNVFVIVIVIVIVIIVIVFVIIIVIIIIIINIISCVV